MAAGSRMSLPLCKAVITSSSLPAITCISAWVGGLEIPAHISNLWFVFRRGGSIPARSPAQAAKRPAPAAQLNNC